MPNLRYLYLCLVDAPELPVLNQVEYVSLGDDQIADLSWLSAAPLKKIDILDMKQLAGNEKLLNEVLKDGIKIYG